MHNDSQRSPNLASRRLQTFRDSMFSLSFDLGGLLAGGILESFTELALRRPWCIALYPIVLTGRGALNGVGAARISTGLHLGTIKPSFRRNTIYYYSVLASLTTLSLLLSTLMGLLSWLFTRSSFGELPLILSTAISSQTITIILTLPATSLIGRESFRRGLDPDAVIYPTTSTIADVWATLSYIISLNLAFSELGTIALRLISIATVLFTLMVVILFHGEREFRTTLRESFLMVTVVTLISSISGLSLSSAREVIESTPGILTVYPAVIDTIGDCAAIFGSILTTRLFIGSMRPAFNELRSIYGELAQIWCAGLIYFLIYGSIGFSIGGKINTLTIPLLVYVTILPIVIIFAFSLAILTFRRELNPDNFVIPFETTLTDTTSTVVLAALLLTLH